MSQGRLEATMASIRNLIRQREILAGTRISEMTAVMTERDCQADERLKLMSELMQRRDSDANTTDANNFHARPNPGKRAVVAKTAAAPSRTPSMAMASNLANVPSTGAFPPPQQTTYRKVAQQVESKSSIRS